HGLAAAESAHQGDQVRRTGLLELLAQTHVAVVVADDREAVVGQLRAEGVGPGDELRSEAHDQEERRIGEVPDDLVLDGDVVGGGLRHRRDACPCRRPGQGSLSVGAWERFAGAAAASRIPSVVRVSHWRGPGWRSRWICSGAAVLVAVSLWFVP